LQLGRDERSFPFSQGRQVVYDHLFQRFVVSKSIAKTERRFVIDNYCARLVDLYGQLSAQEKESLAAQREWVNTEPTMTYMAVDHAKEVLGTCRGTAP